MWRLQTKLTPSSEQQQKSQPPQNPEPPDGSISTNPITPIVATLLHRVSAVVGIKPTNVNFNHFHFPGLLQSPSDQMWLKKPSKRFSSTLGGGSLNPGLPVSHTGPWWELQGGQMFSAPPQLCCHHMSIRSPEITSRGGPA